MKMQCISPFADVLCAMQVAVLANIPEQQAFRCRHSFSARKLLCTSSLADVLCAMYLRRTYLMPAGYTLIIMNITAGGCAGQHS